MRYFDVSSRQFATLGEWSRRRTVPLIAIGVFMMVVGTIAVWNVVAATFTTVFALGGLLIVGAVLHAAAMFTAHRWNVALLDALSAILYAVAGVFALRQPTGAALILTAIVATLFLTGGILRIVAALAYAPPHWGWMAVHGVVTFGLGAVLFYSLPNSALYFPGLVIACDLFASGVSTVAMGFLLNRAIATKGATPLSQRSAA